MILVRGDSGFAIPEMYEFCEKEGLFYVKRGNVPEKPIGELKNHLEADRLSAHSVTRHSIVGAESVGKSGY